MSAPTLKCSGLEDTPAVRVSGWCSPSGDKKPWFSQGKQQNGSAQGSQVLPLRLHPLVPPHPDCCPHCYRSCAGAWRIRHRLCAMPRSLPWASSRRTYRSARPMGAATVSESLPVPETSFPSAPSLRHPCCHQYLGACLAVELTQAVFLLPPAPHSQLFRGGDATAPHLPEVRASWVHTSPSQGLLCPGELRGEPRWQCPLRV